jgi:hypothetical protein
VIDLLVPGASLTWDTAGGRMPGRVPAFVAMRPEARPLTLITQASLDSQRTRPNVTLLAAGRPRLQAHYRAAAARACAACRGHA